MKLFVSYRSTDSEYVDPIVAQLRSLRTQMGKPVYQVWQDKDSIPVGQDWWEAICEGIQNCDVFIFMVSKDSIKSAACIAELSFADKLNVPIIPFVLVGQWQYNSGGKYDLSFWDDIPSELQDEDNRAQFLFQEGVSYVKRLARGVARISRNPLPRFDVAPPPDPRHANDATNDATVIYAEAYDFAFRGEFKTAKRLFRKLVKYRDPTFGSFAYEWVHMIDEYERIHKLLSYDASYTIGMAQLQHYTEKFPTGFVNFFDPLKLSTEQINQHISDDISISMDEAEQAVVGGELPDSPDNSRILFESETPDADIIVANPETEALPAEIEDVQFIADAPEDILVLERDLSEKPQTKTRVDAPTENLQSPGEPKRKKQSGKKRNSILSKFRLSGKRMIVGLVTIIVLAFVITTVVSSFVFVPVFTPALRFLTYSRPSPLPSPSNADFALAERGVTENSQWVPVGDVFDGIEMVLVPAGYFLMGSTNGAVDEQPVTEIGFEVPFWIDRYEVTNEQYGSTGCENGSSEPDQPRNCVDWFDAQAYCEARGGTLPTEAQWEYASRGVDNLIYTWGNEFVANNVVYYENSNNQTAYIGSRPDGASWVGAMDMSGNAWEWTSSIYQSYPYDFDDGRENLDNNISDRVLRGGGFIDTTYLLRSAYRNLRIPDFGNNDIGFRCVRSY